MNYTAPWWLPAGNLQTIWPALYARRVFGPHPQYRRERWTTPDGDFIDVDFLHPAVPPDASPRPLLVLDDPFSALDRKTEEQVFDNLRKMTAGSTVLLISHRLYLFPQMDGVLWIQDGKAVCAAHKELMAQNPQYAALVNAQEGGEQDEPEK